MPILNCGPAADIAEGAMRQFQVDESRQVLVARADGALHACDAVCPHRGAYLGQGDLVGTQVTCPWHGWAFDVATGEGITNPMSSIATYRAWEEDGRVLVDIGGPASPAIS